MSLPFLLLPGGPMLVQRPALRGSARLVPPPAVNERPPKRRRSRELDTSPGLIGLLCVRSTPLSRASITTQFADQLKGSACPPSLHRRAR